MKNHEEVEQRRERVRRVSQPYDRDQECGQGPRKDADESDK